MACKSCRARKIKCDQTRPACQNCRLRSSHCTYVGERRTRPVTDGSGTARRPSLSSHYPRTPSTLPVVAPSSQSISEGDDHDEERQPIRGTGDPGLSPTANGQPPTSNEIVVRTNSRLEAEHPSTLLDRILDGDDGKYDRGCHPAVWMRVEDGDEYTGPSSGICTISDLGLNWLRSHVADSEELCETIQDIRNTLLAHLRQAKCMPRGISSPCTHGRGPTLKPMRSGVVRKYVEAYFSTVQTTFPVLDREQFELQLATFGADQNRGPSSWRALFSAVLASGCRAALSLETAEAFQESGRESWEYFQNALSYESEIIHNATDLMAVQAYAVMTVFAQGLSSPQRLEYTLCSIASRLAQSIGLHRHPSQEWNLGNDEKLHRTRVFWVIYCLDKTIALRCGRPSAINDDEVSCTFPRSVRLASHGESPQGTASAGQDFDFFLSFTKLARICGAVSRRLYSATSLYTPSAHLLETMDHLLQDLDRWKQQIPSEVQPGRPFARIANARGLSRFQLLVLHSSYYYVSCAICRRFMPLFTNNENDQSVITQRTIKRNIEAARCMVLLTKHLDVESFTPGWLVFYYPFTALTTIFVHVVSNPGDASTLNDIALMEVVIGFFGRLEYITSGETAFTKTSEFVRQARRIANRHTDAARSDSRDQASPQRHHSPNDSTSLHTGNEMQNGQMDGFDLLVGCPSQHVRLATAETAVGSNRQRTPSDDMSSQALFSDVMNMLENNPVVMPDESWLENWAPTAVTGS
ncbi:fungal-specific transcription factor domain-containing protein [Dactylonectria macrodidyma]|uniref:Fungal-specific transcription factor domain-containing protein n=1 Tax=Dactylonectria macrodidyma TaxID=307937 RepID=A0A9P9IT26_9HYPO|nr:fungal-specific transcription factor domain-containing protein [Dactylonectria macrodidyma]